MNAGGDLGRVAAQILAQPQERQVGGLGLQQDVERRQPARGGEKADKFKRVRLRITLSRSPIASSSCQCGQGGRDDNHTRSSDRTTTDAPAARR